MPPLAQLPCLAMSLVGLGPSEEGQLGFEMGIPWTGAVGMASPTLPCSEEASASREFWKVAVEGWLAGCLGTWPAFQAKPVAQNGKLLGIQAVLRVGRRGRPASGQ